MDAWAPDPAEGPECDLSLHDAAQLYEISARTLAQHIRCGQLPAYKTHGATGRHWRITREALDAAGYRPRPAPVQTTAEDLVVSRLRQELATARRSAAAERRRADDLDRRLGHALLQCGQLRTALAEATGQTPPAEVDLDAGTARWLISAITGSRADARHAPPADD